MKYLLSLFFVALLFASCNKDAIEVENKADLSYELTESNTLAYKGIFTTLDSKYRATVDITIPITSGSFKDARPKATLTFPNGKTTEAFADFNYTADEVIEDVIFTGNNLSFSFSAGKNGLDAIITNAIFNNTETSIKIAQVRQGLLPVTLTGTFTCTDCATHPVLGSGVTQTFNVMIVNPSEATTDITTQIILGSRDFGASSINEQMNCMSNGGSLTTCPIDGSSFNSLVTWEGDHTFEPLGACDGVIGTWMYDSPNHGLLNGTFISDDACISVLTDLNFNSFTGTGFSPTPAAGQLDSNTFAITGFTDGDLAFGATMTTGDYAQGIANSAVGPPGIYAGVVGAGDNCLLIQSSGGDYTPGTTTIRAQNISGIDFTNVQLTADILYRNDQEGSLTISLDYSTDNVTFTPIPGVATLNTPLASTGTALVLATSLDSVIPVALANNDFLYFRISSSDNVIDGRRDEIAFDNIKMVAY